MPEYLLRLPRVRILHCVKDWGPATKFIGAVQEELAAGRGSTLMIVVDDDRIYPPMRSKPIFTTASDCSKRRFVFRVPQCGQV